MKSKENKIILTDDTPSKEAKLTILSFADDLNPEHWDWTDAERKSLGDIQQMGKIILKRLNDHGIVVREGFGILHDRDETELWSEYERSYITCSVDVHVHFLLKLDPGHTDTLKNLAKIVGISPQQVEIPKSGRYAWDNLLAYLIHVKYAKKYQYQPTDVVVLIGKKHYMDYYRERIGSWERQKARLLNCEVKLDLEAVISKMRLGEITYEQLISDPAKEYFCLVNHRALLKIRDEINDFCIEKKSVEKNKNYASPLLLNDLEILLLNTTLTPEGNIPDDKMQEIMVILKRILRNNVINTEA